MRSTRSAPSPRKEKCNDGPVDGCVGRFPRRLDRPSRRAARDRCHRHLGRHPAMVTIRVLVNGRQVEIPEWLLSEALAPLRLSFGGYVSLESYASSVALALAALERTGVVRFNEGEGD